LTEEERAQITDLEKEINIKRKEAEEQGIKKSKSNEQGIHCYED